MAKRYHPSKYPRPWARARLIPWLLLACTWPAAANDFEAAGLAWELAPVEASGIRLVTERVVLTQTADDWRAEATYIFHNPTAAPIATIFAFPEGCPAVEGDDSTAGQNNDPQFRELVTLVRGQSVATRIIEGRPWEGVGLCIGRVHAFDIALRQMNAWRSAIATSSPPPPGSGSRRSNTSPAPAPCGTDPSTQQSLSCPRAWRPSARACWPDGFRFVGFEERTGHGPGRPRRLPLRGPRLDPSQDFVVSLHGWPIPITLAGEKGVALPCPDPATMLDDPSFNPAEASPLASLSDADLGLCRNLRYARHGYPFQRGDLRQVFYAESPCQGNRGATPRRFRLAAPNPLQRCPPRRRRS